MPDYLSVKEAAERLDLSPAAVRALIQKGELQGAFQTPARAWVIPAESVTAYKAGRRAQPRKPAARPKRETTKKEKDEKKKPARKKKRPARKSPGLGLDDVVELIRKALAKSDKPAGGNLLTTLLEQFAGQKRGAAPDQIQALLGQVGQKDPDLLQEVLKSAAVPDLAGLLEKLKPQDD